MSEKIDQFCHDLRERLTKVDDRLNSFKDSVETANAKAKADIQAKLDESKADIEARKKKAEEVHSRIKANMEEMKEETAARVEEWKHQRQVKKLEKRADRAENYAAGRAWLAMLSVAEAEFAMLEAVAARIEADEVAAG